MAGRYVEHEGAPYPPVDGTELCRSDPAAFFPEKGDNGARKRAKTMCNGDWEKGIPPCHVLDQCLAYAVSHVIGGVWGGADESQRKRMQAAQGITPVPMHTVLDPAMVIRAHRRGMPDADIARLAGATLNSVQQVLSEQRRRDAARRRARQAEAS